MTKDRLTREKVTNSLAKFSCDEGVLIKKYSPEEIVKHASLCQVWLRVDSHENCDIEQSGCDLKTVNQARFSNPRSDSSLCPSHQR